MKRSWCATTPRRPAPEQRSCCAMRRVRSSCRSFRYVLIDEYQDTNHAQFVIADAIAKAHGNLFVVVPISRSTAGRVRTSATSSTSSRYPGTEIIAATELPLGAHRRRRGRLHLQPRRKHKDLHTDLGEAARSP